MSEEPIISVENLSICFGKGANMRTVVDDVSFSAPKGKLMALVGESGSGKTLISRTMLRILPRGAMVHSGEIFFDNDGQKKELINLPEKEMRAIRGGKISMIFQEPMSALSPLHTIGAQVQESYSLHTGEYGASARLACLEKFKAVGFPDPERAYLAYPYELSGGLRQRAMIAMAMICKPALLIADEPTTALDVTTQAQVLDLIKQLQSDTGMSVMLITHDLGVMATMADTVTVMRKGRVVEAGAAVDIIKNPRHSYTQALINAAPEIPEPDDIVPPIDVVDPILCLSNLHKTYKLRGGTKKEPRLIRAVCDVNLKIPRGKTVAIVGESGSGKSTLANLALRAQIPNEGSEVTFKSRDGDTKDVLELCGDELDKFRKSVQVIMQDPYASLSPRMTVQDILTEPMRVHCVGDVKSRKLRAKELMQKVGLDPNNLLRFPHAFSGGQRQRICIARALALNPELIICDEPTSALDVSVQAQVLDLLENIKEEMGLSYLFISHDLAVVARLADIVAVMRNGRIVEQAPTQTLFAHPKHPYTQALIAAHPEPDLDHALDLKLVASGAGTPDTWPAPYGYKDNNVPMLHEVEPGHYVRCQG